MIRTLIIIIILLLLNTCRGKDNKQQISNLINDWQGREIIFPSNIAFTHFVADSSNPYTFTLDTVNFRRKGSIRYYLCRFRRMYRLQAKALTMAEIYEAGRQHCRRANFISLLFKFKRYRNNILCFSRELL